MTKMDSAAKQAEPAMTGKVVAFVTRRVPSRSCDEILVFSHPMTGVQFPAGSLFDGEDDTDGCLRELYEETGLVGDDILLVAKVGQWTEESSELSRHAFHLRCRRDTPEEWWVVTPDGGGLCWRCHWVALDGAEPLHPAQRPWLDRTRHRLGEAAGETWSWPPLPPELVDETTIDVFFAPGVGDQWYSASWLPVTEGLDDLAHQSTALAVTAEGDAVIVRDHDGREHLPGGTREPGEALRTTLERELREEACASVVDAELLGYRRVVRRGRDGVTGLHYGSRWWARVELDPWIPEWEMAARRVVPFHDVLGELHSWRFPVNERWITAAMDVERSRRSEAPVAGPTG